AELATRLPAHAVQHHKHGPKGREEGQHDFCGVDNGLDTHTVGSNLDDGNRASSGCAPAAAARTIANGLLVFVAVIRRLRGATAAAAEAIADTDRHFGSGNHGVLTVIDGIRKHVVWTRD